MFGERGRKKSHDEAALRIASESLEGQREQNRIAGRGVRIAIVGVLTTFTVGVGSIVYDVAFGHSSPKQLETRDVCDRLDQVIDDYFTRIAVRVNRDQSDIAAEARLEQSSDRYGSAAEAVNDQVLINSARGVNRYLVLALREPRQRATLDDVAYPIIRGTSALMEGVNRCETLGLELPAAAQIRVRAGTQPADSDACFAAIGIVAAIDEMVAVEVGPDYSREWESRALAALDQLGAAASDPIRGANITLARAIRERDTLAIQPALAGVDMVCRAAGVPTVDVGLVDLRDDLTLLANP